MKNSFLATKVIEASRRLPKTVANLRRQGFTWLQIVRFATDAKCTRDQDIFPPPEEPQASKGVWGSHLSGCSE